MLTTCLRIVSQQFVALQNDNNKSAQAHATALGLHKQHLGQMTRQHANGDQVGNLLHSRNVLEDLVDFQQQLEINPLNSKGGLKSSHPEWIGLICQRSGIRIDSVIGKVLKNSVTLVY